MPLGSTLALFILNYFTFHFSCLLAPVFSIRFRFCKFCSFLTVDARLIFKWFAISLADAV